MFLEGKDKINVGQQAIIALVISLFHQISFMTDTDYYSPDENIEVLWKCCKVANILMENDDVPIIQRYKASALMKMADNALKQNEKDNAIEYIQLAVDHVIKGIRSPQNPPQSLLVNQIEISLISRSDFYNLQLHRLSLDEKYDSIRYDARFKNICNMLEQYL